MELSIGAEVEVGVDICINIGIDVLVVVKGVANTMMLALVSVSSPDVTMTTLPSIWLRSKPRTASAIVTTRITVTLPRDFPCDVECLFEVITYLEPI